MRRISALIIGAGLTIALVLTAPVASASVRGGGKTFVGPADDAFFVDLGSLFDGVAIG